MPPELIDGGELKLILERIAPGSEITCFKLWACRGEGKGCKRNEFRERKKHCENCVDTNNEENPRRIIQERLKRGDA